jgi:hypothetical protein
MKIESNTIAAKLTLESKQELDTLIYILREFSLDPHKKPFHAKDFAGSMFMELTKCLDNSTAK